MMLIVTPIVGFCNSSMFCCVLIYVHSSFIFLKGPFFSDNLEGNCAIFFAVQPYQPTPFLGNIRTDSISTS